MDTTKAAYCKRAEQILKTFSRETGRSWKDSPVFVIEWFTAKAPNLRKSSFRVYKASLLAFMTEYGPVEAVQALQGLPESVSGLNVVHRATSTDKLKRVPLDLFHAIIGEIEKSQSDYANLLVNLIYCNSIVGLRPAEWATATIKENKLSCQNAKHSHGRGRTGKRMIDLGGFDPSILESFQEAIESIAAFKRRGVSFEQIYDSCRQLLYRVQEKLFPNRKEKLTLYSTRHQSVANLKYAGATAEEIAVMFGHSSLRTAKLHYASKKSGRRMDVVPVAHDILPMGEVAPDGND